jgi:hypothetical protein
VKLSFFLIGAIFTSSIVCMEPQRANYTDGKLKDRDIVFSDHKSNRTLWHLENSEFDRHKGWDLFIHNTKGNIQWAKGELREAEHWFQNVVKTERGSEQIRGLNRYISLQKSKLLQFLNDDKRTEKELFLKKIA